MQYFTEISKSCDLSCKLASSHSPLSCQRIDILTGRNHLYSLSFNIYTYISHMYICYHNSSYFVNHNFYWYLVKIKCQKNIDQFLVGPKKTLDCFIIVYLNNFLVDKFIIDKFCSICGLFGKDSLKHSRYNYKQFKITKWKYSRSSKINFYKFLV